MKPKKTSARHRLITIVAFFVIMFFSCVAKNLPVTDAATTAATSSIQDQINANNQQIADINQQIATYQAELQQVGADKKTLKQAINALDLKRSKVEAQISATQHQINVAQLQIQQLGGEINDTKQTIATDQAALGESLKILQKADNRSLLIEVLSPGTIDKICSDVNATLQIEGTIQNNMQTLQNTQGM